MLFLKGADQASDLFVNKIACFSAVMDSKSFAFFSFLVEKLETR